MVDINATCLAIGRNKTEIISSQYEGIPQTLILNLVAWLFLLLLFTMLRQQAWDYGRLALVNSGSASKKWTQLFYAQGNTEEILFSLNEGSQARSPSVESPSNEGPSGETSRESSRMQRQSSVLDSGVLSWVKTTWNLKKEQILKHNGPDAAHYLSFQEHLIVVMLVISAVAVFIILPINFQGSLSGDINTFSHTTIANVDPKSPLLWVHVFFAIAFVPLVVLTMRLSSGRYAGKIASTKTIMITGVHKRDCNKNAIQEYLRELFPDIDIRDIQLAYNIKKLTKVAAEYERVIEARIYCEQNRGRVPSMKIKNRFGCYKHEDALTYYKDSEQKLCGEVARLKSASLNEPLGIAFVTLTSTQAAKYVISNFKTSSMRTWNLNFAPTPSDIFWENLTDKTANWYCKWGAVNLCLFLVLFFLTTPTYVVSFMNDVWNAAKNVTKNNTEDVPDTNSKAPLITEFLPTLLLWTFTALMPTIVAFSETWLNHWTKSKQNYAVMTKSFGYLLFMILILPSLGFVTASAFLEWSLNFNTTEATKLQCIFLPDRGAFFVNYVITAAFIGTALELIRFPDLILYIYKLLTAKSKAETPHIRKSIIYEFPFGIHYSWTVMLFTMATVYSLTCPMITPFVLIYLLFKHFNDKHNLYFVYGPSSMVSKGGGKIHSTAVTMTKFSVVLLLISMSALAYIRNGYADWGFIMLIGSLAVTVVLFCSMSSIKKCASIRLTVNENGQEPHQLYVADVLRNSRIMGGSSPSHVSYGSDTTTDYNLTQSQSDSATPEHVQVTVKS